MYRTLGHRGHKRTHTLSPLGHDGMQRSRLLYRRPPLRTALPPKQASPPGLPRVSVDSSIHLHSHLFIPASLPRTASLCSRESWRTRRPKTICRVGEATTPDTGRLNLDPPSPGYPDLSSAGDFRQISLFRD